MLTSFVLLCLASNNLQNHPNGSQTPQPYSINYNVYADPNLAQFHVNIRVKSQSNLTSFHIPAWTPGYYHIESFQKNIHHVRAKSLSGQPLSITHSASRTWTVHVKKNNLFNFSYDVTADDAGLGFFGSMLNANQGFINGASAYMYIDGQMSVPDKIHVHVPPGWQIASPLSFTAKSRFVARTGYDEFIDSPLQIGHFTVKTFTVDGVPYRAVYVSQDNKFQTNLDVLTSHLKIVSKPALDMFVKHAFHRYTYFIHFAVGDFAGGLEHRASTCIAIEDRPDFNIDSIAAHENFHAWNVKQIRPYVLGPFDYSKADPTGSLWFMEGVTDYYADLLTYRSGLEDRKWLLATYGSKIADLQNSEDRNKFTLEQCSRDCWKSDGFGYGDLSYYTKGLVAGLIFDAAIRSLTHGRKSLDDVMRYLFNKYRLPHPGFGHNGILNAMNEVVGTPNAFNDLYDRMIRSTQPMPYEILRSIGLEVAEGKSNAVKQDFSVENGIVSQAGGQAQASGLLPGDKVVSVVDETWNGVTSNNPHQFLVTVERAGKPIALTIPYDYSTRQRSWLMRDPIAGIVQSQLRNQWLSRPNPIETNR